MDESLISILDTTFWPFKRYRIAPWWVKPVFDDTSSFGDWWWIVFEGWSL